MTRSHMVAFSLMITIIIPTSTFLSIKVQSFFQIEVNYVIARISLTFCSKIAACEI